MATIDIIDPLTGSKLHEIESHSAADVALRFLEGSKAQKSWGAMPPRERAKIAARIADAVVNNQEQLMDVLQRETGKSRAHAFEEVTGALGAITYYERSLQRQCVEAKSRLVSLSCSPLMLSQLLLGLLESSHPGTTHWP